MNSVTEDYSKHLEEVKKYVRSYFNDITNNKLLYHNLAHTKGVAEAATQIAEHYKLNERDNFIVVTASWFHDKECVLATQMP